MEISGPERHDGDPETSLRTLVERLLTPSEPDGRPRRTPPRFYPGRLPDGLPSGLPIPGDATVVGGMTQNMGRGLWIIEILLDVDVSVEDFREYYRRRLFAAGWSEDDEWSHERSGFMPSGLPGFFVRAARRSPMLWRLFRGRVPGLPRPFPDVLRLGHDGPRLHVTAEERRHAPTEVRLRVLTGGRGRRPRRDPAWEAIPSLMPPPNAYGRRDEAHTGVLHPPRGARGLPGGGGERWEADGAYSHAILETDLELGDLASYYKAQLEEAGWALADEGQSGPQAWSLWTFADAEGNPWDGTFSALRLPRTPVRYLLQVQGGRATESG